MAVRLCDFAAVRCFLTMLNVFYIAISLFLIGVVIASRTLSYFTSPSILAGLAVCASVLFLVAILGLAGTIKHHQVVLFFYMVSLGLSGIVLFIVSVAALAAPDTYRGQFFEGTWRGLSSHDKQYIQDTFNCCGFNNDSRHLLNFGNCSNQENECHKIGHPLCNTSTLIKQKHCCHIDHTDNNTDLTCVEPTFLPANCTELVQCDGCDPCYTSWKEAVSNTVWVAGSFGLIFSLTQVAGIILTFRYRNLKDPDLDPRSLL